MLVISLAVLAQGQPSDDANVLQDGAAWAALLTFIGLALTVVWRAGHWAKARWDARPYLALDFKSVVQMSERSLPTRVTVKREVHMANWIVGLEYPSGLQIGAEHGTVGTPQPEWTQGGISRFPKGYVFNVPLTMNLKEPLRGQVKLTAIVGDGTRQRRQNA